MVLLQPSAKRLCQSDYLRLMARHCREIVQFVRVVLKVEQDVKAPWPFSRTGAPRKRWRDAKMVDLTEAAMRALMDLRNQPQLVPESAYGAALAHAIRLRHHQALLIGISAQPDAAWTKARLAGSSIIETAPVELSAINTSS